MVISSRLMKIQLQIPMKSGVPGDQVIWDMHATAPVGWDQTNLDAFATKVNDWIGHTESTVGASMASRMANTIDAGTSACKAFFYAVPAVRGHLGAPVGMSSWDFPTTATSALPSEVAIALQLHAPYGTAVEFGGGGTRPRARLRNRMYIGPVAISSLENDSTTHKVTVADSTITLWVEAYKDFYDAVTGLAEPWVPKVFSPTNWQDYDVSVVKADDAYDTQRRRGVKANYTYSVTV